MSDRGFQRGVGLLRQGFSILIRDVEGALADGQTGLSVRRAQESVECSVKGALAILGLGVPKDHDVGRLRDALSLPFPVIAFHLLQSLDYFLMAKPEPPRRPDRLDVLSVKRGSWTAHGSAQHADFSRPLRLTVDGLTCELFSGADRVITATITQDVLQGTWIQKKVTDLERALIQNYVSKLAKNRDAAFYLDKEFGADDAALAKQQAWTVARVMLGAVGLDLAAGYPVERESV